MKKRVIFIIIILILVGIMVGRGINEILVGEDKDLQGELAESSQQQDISIVVFPAVPIITIVSPENKTYSETTVLLNYTIKNEIDTVWYNLDNLENITIDSPKEFSVSEGVHTLYLYANNTYGTSVENVSFTVSKEAPPQNGGGNGGGGNGGGRRTQPIIIKDISLDKDKIEISLNRNATEEDSITITNIGDSKLNISLQNLGLEEFLKISETSFELDAGETKTIILEFATKEDTPLDLYVGSLLVKTEGIEKEIPVILEVKAGSLIEEIIEIPKKPLNMVVIMVIVVIVVLIVLSKSGEAGALRQTKRHGKFSWPEVIKFNLPFRRT